MSTPVRFTIAEDCLGFWVEAHFRGFHQHWAGPWKCHQKAYKWRQRFEDLWGLKRPGVSTRRAAASY